VFPTFAQNLYFPEMPIIIEIVFLILVLAYSILIAAFYISWKKLKPFKTKPGNPEIFASIVIPARNEELNISGLLDDLLCQKYLKSKFEIIIVNDHSEDNTLAIANNYKTRLDNLLIIDLAEGNNGKKAALYSAIIKAKGELIITLDADCRIGKNWLATICGFYEDFKSRMIIAPLLYDNEKSWFEKMQSLEISSLVASTAGAAALGRPIMCNGANLAFTRETYLQCESNLKAGIASGDDIFLMLEIKKHWPGSIKFIKSFDAACFTEAEPNIDKFIMQRKRWASKSKHYNDKDILFVAVVVFLANLAICLSFIAAFFNYHAILIFIILLCLKSIPDFLLLNSFSNYFSKRKLLNYFLLTQLIYPFYLVFIAVYGNIGKFEWKKRIYK
jgi:cellulose synthase/poly-beta-1,6-N-acetylglucosamine synthase-like glycosyltransferase